METNHMKDVSKENKIDFIIMWVDGSDPEWLAEKKKYTPSIQDDDRTHRYRDWDNLKYWFRGVEKYAPWVNHIFFVTCGHLPKWLNTNHPKLRIVNHKDYMPEEYLPTFNSCAIELNFHRIEELGEQFVFFNDDLFLTAPVSETDFFKNGLPCDAAALNVHCVDADLGFNYVMYQAIGITNKYFDFHESIRRNWRKWINLKNGKYMWRTLYLLPCPRFPGIYQPHLANSFLKETFRKLWELEGPAFDETCRNKFRNKLSYNQWAMRNYQLASGQFEPRPINIGKNFLLGHKENHIDEICDYIRLQKGKMTVINDEEMTDEEFEVFKKRIKDAFESILPEKSAFEKP